MNLFDSYVDAGLDFITKRCTQAIPQVCQHLLIVSRSSFPWKRQLSHLPVSGCILKLLRLRTQTSHRVTSSAVHRSRRAGAGVLTYFAGAGAGAGVCSPPVKL